MRRRRFFLNYFRGFFLNLLRRRRFNYFFRRLFFNYLLCRLRLCNVRRRFLRRLFLRRLFLRRLRRAADLGRNELARALQNLAKLLAQVGPFAELLGQDVPGAEQRVGRAGNLSVGVGKVGRPGVQVGTGGIGFENLPGKTFEAPFSGLGGEGLLLGPKRQIEVFQPLGRGGRKDLLREGFGQLPLRLDGAENGLLPVGQLAHFGQPVLDLADLLLVEPAGLILSVSGDKGDRIPVIQKLDDRLDLG